MGRGRRLFSGSTLQRNNSLRNSSLRNNSLQLVPETPFTKEELSRYADQVLDINNIGEGDYISLEISDPQQKVFSAAIADAAFRRGAIYELVLPEAEYDEGELEKSVKKSLKNNSLFLGLRTFTEEEIDSNLVSANPDSIKEFSEAYDEAELRWSVSMWPTQEWAEKVYPELDPQKAYRQLGKDILEFSRCSEDSKETWEEHMHNLRERSETLNNLDIDTIYLKTDFTELKIKPLAGSKFLPAEWYTEKGDLNAVNLPSEEIFTTPDPNSVEGKFKTSKPWVIGSNYIKDICGEFKEGKLVQLFSPSNPEYNQALKEMFIDDNESNLNKIGELGLVSPNNLIGQKNRTYFNTILDENAGTHFGLGNYYKQSLIKEAQEAGVEGNKSSDHIDLIIGQANMIVSAKTKDGRTIDITKDGDWQI